MKQKEAGDMVNGPQGLKRPAGVIGCAVTIAKIATGEIKNKKEEKSGRITSGCAGVLARIQKPTLEEHSVTTNTASSGELC